VSSSASISLDAVDVVDTNDSIERCLCYAHDSAEEASMKEGCDQCSAIWGQKAKREAKDLLK